MACWLHLLIFICGRDILKYAVRLKLHIHVMQAHCVESEIGDAVGHHLGVLVFGEAGAEAEVRSPEPRAGAVFEIEMPVFDLDEAVLACRSV